MATQYLSAQEMQDIIQYPTSHDIEWPTALNKKIALSWTKFQTFDQCPRKYRDQYLLGLVPYVETPVLKWGNDVHKAMELYITRGTPLPPKMLQFKPVADALLDRVEEFRAEGKLKVDLFAEQKWAIDLTGRACGYFDKNVWIRGQADVGYGTRVSLKTLDWKTGKGKYPKPEQLELMALLAVARPELSHYTRVDGMLMFLEAGFPVRLSVDTTPGLAYRDLLLKWQRRALRILDYIQRDYWPENSTPLCGWCDVTSCPENTRDQRLRRV